MRITTVVFLDIKERCQSVVVVAVVVCQADTPLFLLQWNKYRRIAKAWLLQHWISSKPKDRVLY